MRPALGIRLTPYDDPRRIARLAETAEKGGFDYIWVSDSQMLWRDSYITLALCAARTHRARIGTCVTNPFARNVTVCASSISTIDEISSGRAVLGIGSGGSSVMRLGFKPASPSALKEAVVQLRAIIAGENVRVGSERVRIEWLKRRIPIYVAATGPRMLEAAGEVADGVLVNVGVTRECFDYAMQSIRKGMEKSKRERRDISIVSYVYCSVSRDDLRARELMRPYIAWFLNNAELLRVAKVVPSTSAVKRADMTAIERVMHDTQPLRATQSAGELVTEEMIDAFGIAGNPEACSRKLKDIMSFGADQVSIRTPFSFPISAEHNQERMLETFVSDIIPSLD